MGVGIGRQSVRNPVQHGRHGEQGHRDAVGPLQYHLEEIRVGTEVDEHVLNAELEFAQTVLQIGRLFFQAGMQVSLELAAQLGIVLQQPLDSEYVSHRVLGKHQRIPQLSHVLGHKLAGVLDAEQGADVRQQVRPAVEQQGVPDAVQRLPGRAQVVQQLQTVVRRLVDEQTGEYRLVIAVPVVRVQYRVGETQDAVHGVQMAVQRAQSDQTRPVLEAASGHAPYDPVQLAEGGGRGLREVPVKQHRVERQALVLGAQRAVGHDAVERHLAVAAAVVRDPQARAILVHQKRREERLAALRPVALVHGARQHQKHVGPPPVRHPLFAAVDHPLAAVGARRLRPGVLDVVAVLALVHAERGHALAGRHPRQVPRLLFAGAGGRDALGHAAVGRGVAELAEPGGAVRLGRGRRGQPQAAVLAGYADGVQAAAAAVEFRRGRAFRPFGEHVAQKIPDVQALGERRGFFYTRPHFISGVAGNGGRRCLRVLAATRDRCAESAARQQHARKRAATVQIITSKTITLKSKLKRLSK